jgi:predicted permease
VSGGWRFGAWRELRQAARQLSRDPGFALAAILVLALGSGAVTALYALLHAIVLSPLPYPQSERLVAVGHAAAGLQLEGAGLSDGTYLHYRTHSRAFTAIAMYHESLVNLGGDDGGEAERVPVAVVTHDFFTVLGARTLLGRLPTAADAARDGERVALISHDLWRRRFAADPGIVGTTIEPNRVARRVIGVLAPGFALPSPEVGIFLPSDPDPAAARAADLYNHGIGRLAAGFDAAAAARDLDRLIATLPDAYPDLTARVLAESRLRAVVTPLQEVVLGDTESPLWLLLGGMALLLLIACANVANLLLARAEHRHRELAIRTALGAGAGHLLRGFVAESLVLAGAAGGAGLLLAAGIVRLLVEKRVAELPRLEEVAVDGGVVAFAAGLAVAIAGLLAAVQSIRLRRGAAAAGLREGSFGASAGRARQRVRRALVAAQVALALTLLVGAALLAQSFWRLLRADPGFAAAGVLTAEIALPRTGYGTYAETERFWETLLQRVRALPGVTAAGMVSALPLVPQPAYHDLAIDVEERPGETRAALSVYHATPSYFGAMGIPLAAGRGLRRADLLDVERPVLLSAAAARRLFPRGDALGKRIRRSVAGDDEAPWATVVGVVTDVPRERIGGAAAEIVYLPVLAAPTDPGLRPFYGALVVRGSAPAATLAPAVRGVLRALDPHLPLANVRPLGTIVAASAAHTSFVMLLLGCAAIAALALGTVGLYSVLAYSVQRRTREFGIRLALGAARGEVRRMVLRESMTLVGGGVCAGTITALLLAQLLRSLLYGVGPNDPLVLAAMAGLVLLVSLLAGWLPARRAVGVDPASALRGE